CWSRRGESRPDRTRPARKGRAHRASVGGPASPDRDPNGRDRLAPVGGPALPDRDPRADASFLLRAVVVRLLAFIDAAALRELLVDVLDLECDGAVAGDI